MLRDTRTKGGKTGRGVFILLYGAVCILLVAMVLLFRFSAVRDYRDRSAAFNAALDGIFEKLDITDEDGPRATEKDAPGKRWREYARNVQVPGSVDRVALFIQLREAAKANGLALTVTGEHADTFSAKAEADGLPVYSLSGRVLPREQAQPGQTKKVALVIDDVGYTRDVSGFLELGVPITFAILPHERYSNEIVRELTEKGIPFILHLPLEPEKYPAVDPGKAAILLSMSEDEVRRKFTSDVEAVPGICGVSNHMGSAYSQNEEKMRFLVGLVKERGLFYFDSYTAAKTRAADAARAVGLPFAENGLFLDVQDDPAFMKKQCGILLERVRRTGRGIAIGHIQKKHMVPALAEAIPEFRQAGIEFVYLKDLVRVLPPAASGKLVRKPETHEHSRH